ncbi:MAG TPA: 5'-3' exonuclease H3TH domain-containing protein [Candidatus Krumholzibacteria bacterium]|nr:5'-3' exonuclease H3TH domain-containing protein [Candidatus Krumholzibacteria bacterium]
MQVHLVDGTYELFRHYYALPSRLDADGGEVGGMVGVVTSVVSMIREGATHLGVATDHVIESFRNEMYPGYKTGDGIDPALRRQFHPLEEALRALGVVVWAMVDQEADDALAAAAQRAHADPDVARVFICTPDKDLAQCVRGDRVVQFDRRKRTIRNEEGVRERFGVGPESIPDYLALVGDAADGFPGVPGWGERSAAAVLARYHHLEAIPEDATQWDVRIRGAASLASSLRDRRDDAMLFRKLATLCTDAAVFASVEELRWRGPTAAFPPLCRHLGVPDLAEAVSRL